MPISQYNQSTDQKYSIKISKIVKYIIKLRFFQTALYEEICLYDRSRLSFSQSFKKADEKSVSLTIASICCCNSNFASFTFTLFSRFQINLRS